MSKNAIVTNYKIKTDKAPPMRIALISDVHERVPNNAAELIEELSPDLIAVAGDTFERYYRDLQEKYTAKHYNIFKRLIFTAGYYVNRGMLKAFCRGNRPSNEKTREFLTRISRVAPIYMSVGNHEQRFLDEDIALIEELGINLLDNSDTAFDVGGRIVRIGGLSTFYDEDWLGNFAGKDGFRILLCHHPSFYDRFNLGEKADLVLAGHNHGGQIRFGNRGVISSDEGFFPKYDKGIFYGKFIISAGCANTIAIPRINNPREVICIDINVGGRTPAE